ERVRVRWEVLGHQAGTSSLSPSSPGEMGRDAGGLRPPTDGHDTSTLILLRSTSSEREGGPQSPYGTRYDAVRHRLETWHRLSQRSSGPFRDECPGPGRDRSGAPAGPRRVAARRGGHVRRGSSR